MIHQIDKSFRCVVDVFSKIKFHVKKGMMMKANMRASLALKKTFFALKTIEGCIFAVLVTEESMQQLSRVVISTMHFAW